MFKAWNFLTVSGPPAAGLLNPQASIGTLIREYIVRDQRLLRVTMDTSRTILLIDTVVNWKSGIWVWVKPTQDGLAMETCFHALCREPSKTFFFIIEEYYTKQIQLCSTFCNALKLSQRLTFAVVQC